MRRLREKATVVLASALFAAACVTTEDVGRSADEPVPSGPDPRAALPKAKAALPAEERGGSASSSSLPPTIPS